MQVTPDDNQEGFFCQESRFQTIQDSKHISITQSLKDPTQALSLNLAELQPSSNNPPCCNLGQTSPRSPRRASKFVHSLKHNPLINHTMREEWMIEIYENKEASIIVNNVRKDLTAGLSIQHHNKHTGCQHNSDQLAERPPIETADVCGLVFQANYEGSNLDLVAMVHENDFELYMRPDTNTYGHFQWFNFRVQNVDDRKLTRHVKFRIKNLLKKNIIYKQGMAPYFSIVEPMQHSTEWVQLPESVSFREDSNGCYSMSFGYTFTFPRETVQFCTSPPYGLSRIKQLTQFAERSSVLCTSLLGHKIRKYIIGDDRDAESYGVAIARQHPGESVGSLMMEGFFNQHMTSTRGSKICWIVIPMLNVDGVYLGNNRTGIAGYDLNRLHNFEQTLSFNRDRLTPQVSALYSLMRMLRQKHKEKLRLFLDFHGHSSRQNVFTYGPPQTNSKSEAQIFKEARLFPELIASINPIFKSDECSYNIPKGKSGTARSVAFYKHKIPFTYTVEASFGLSDGRKLRQSDYIRVGRDIAIATDRFLRYLMNKSSLEEQELENINNCFSRIEQRMSSLQIHTKSDGSDDQQEQDQSGSDDDYIKNTARDCHFSSVELLLQQIQSTNKEKQPPIKSPKTYNFPSSLRYNSNDSEILKTGNPIKTNSKTPANANVQGPKFISKKVQSKTTSQAISSKKQVKVPPYQLNRPVVISSKNLRHFHVKPVTDKAGQPPETSYFGQDQRQMHYADTQKQETYDILSQLHQGPANSELKPLYRFVPKLTAPKTNKSVSTTVTRHQIKRQIRAIIAKNERTYRLNTQVYEPNLLVQEIESGFNSHSIDNIKKQTLPQIAETSKNQSGSRPKYIISTKRSTIASMRLPGSGIRSPAIYQKDVKLALPNERVEAFKLQQANQQENTRLKLYEDEKAPSGNKSSSVREYLSANKNNKVGTKMLIINEF